MNAVKDYTCYLTKREKETDRQTKVSKKLKSLSFILGMSHSLFSVTFFLHELLEGEKQEEDLITTLTFISFSSKSCNAVIMLEVIPMNEDQNKESGRHD